MSASESQSALVLELAEEFLERYRNGERPSLKEYIDRHPALADEIKEVFPAMAMMEKIAIADESLAQASRSRQPPEALQQVGDYRIIREIGHGGMGIVYEAEQVSLGRHVALKLLPQKMLLDERSKRRFEREAKSAAKLHHTNIVPVFGVGEHEGLPYYVMQFIPGLGLDEVLAELHGSTRQAGGSTPRADGWRTSRLPQGRLRRRRGAVALDRSLYAGSGRGCGAGFRSCLRAAGSESGPTRGDTGGPDRCDRRLCPGCGF
jgi:hypothetical protein